uniref:Amine oxidase domain-containing protein n=1 Tax=Solanum lycopersicum TaxID=4081 RepID=K4BYZ2_SOLLC
MILAAPSKNKVIVIGAGLAWLVAALQLMLYGFLVIVFEGRKYMKDAYYELFDKASKVRQELSQVISLVKGSETFQKDSRVARNVEQSGSITFIPELPQQNLDTIKRLGLGVLNKVAMLFPYVFWDSNIYIFGHVADNLSWRGGFFVFFNHTTVFGRAFLFVLVAG